MTDATIAALVDLWIAQTYAQADLAALERRMQEES